MVFGVGECFPENFSKGGWFAYLITSLNYHAVMIILLLVLLILIMVLSFNFVWLLFGIISLILAAYCWKSLVCFLETILLWFAGFWLKLDLAVLGVRIVLRFFEG